MEAYNDSSNLNRTTGTIQIGSSIYALRSFQIKPEGVLSSGSGSGGWESVRTTSTDGQTEYTNSTLSGKTIQLVVVDRAVQVEGDD